LHYDVPGPEHKFRTWTDTTGLHQLACYLIEWDFNKLQNVVSLCSLLRHSLPSTIPTTFNFNGLRDDLSSSKYVICYCRIFILL